MSDQIFWWIGYIVVAISLIVGALVILFWLYANFIHGRFSAILFRKGQRRISIASWYNARLMSDENFTADDWPICERPLYLSYRIGQRRLFFIAGTLGPHRHAVIHGEHPEPRP